MPRGVSILYFASLKISISAYIWHLEQNHLWESFFHVVITKILCFCKWEEKSKPLETIIIQTSICFHPFYGKKWWSNNCYTGPIWMPLLMILIVWVHPQQFRWRSGIRWCLVCLSFSPKSRVAQSIPSIFLNNTSFLYLK